MTKVKEGDLDKLGLLFERYHRMLFAFFFRMHKDRGRSEDLVQNVFMRILKYRKGFKGEGSFKVWMFHIARNASNDAFNKKSKDILMDNDDDFSRRLVTTDEDESRLEDEAKLRILEAALDKMPEEKKELIVMSKLEGVQYKEIAALEGVTEGNVKVGVFRALRNLKEEYQDIRQKIDYNL